MKILFFTISMIFGDLIGFNRLGNNVFSHNKYITHGVSRNKVCQGMCAHLTSNGIDILRQLLADPYMHISVKRQLLGQINPKKENSNRRNTRRHRHHQKLLRRQ